MNSSSPIVARRSRLAPFLAVIALAVVTAGCQFLPGTSDKAALDGTSWTGVSIGGQPPIAGSEPTLRFDGEQLGGSTGCNSFGGGFGLEGGRFKVGDIAATEMACMDALGEQEARFFEILRAADRLELGPASLRISGPAGSLEFRPA